MKISINNFKSIGSLADYEMRPLTILSGTNSSGKSSFIQLLLLLKQTLEDDSAQRPLNLDGKFFQVHNYLDILKDKDKRNKLKVGFVFNKLELENFRSSPELDVYDALNYDLHIKIEFDWLESENRVFVSLFEIDVISESEKLENFTRFQSNDNLGFGVETNVGVILSKFFLSRNIEFSIKRINYSAFLPTELEIEFLSSSTELPDGTMSRPEKTILKEVPKIEGIKSVLKDFFNKLNYVGPLRNAPEQEYESTGIDEGNVAEVLCQLSQRNTSFYKIEERQENIHFVKAEDNFLNAVKYWLCEQFKMCANIYSEKKGDSYIIYVVSLSGIVSTINHVGFGISQVLPIIVEGLRMRDNETLALEQPEIHLHPKVQSSLADFLISLVEQGKQVIVETHSDHLITRLRRRIAEDPVNRLEHNILLTFVESGQNDVLFKNIGINDFGIIELPYPDDFIERADVELKAILKAQMKKRLNQTTK